MSTTSTQGPATALRRGDRVLSVDGRAITWADPLIPLSLIHPGQIYTLVVKRGAEIISLPLRMARAPGVDWDVVATLATALMLLLTGSWILISGAGSLTARLALSTFLLSSLAMTGLVLAWYPGWGPVTTPLALILARLARPLYSAVGWDFISRFPHPVPEGRLIRFLRRLFYALAFILWAAANLPFVLEIAHVPYSPGFRVLELLSPASSFGAACGVGFEIAICLASCLVLFRNYRLLVDRDSRRRIRWAASSFALISVSILCLRLLELAFSATGYRALAVAATIADTVATLSVTLMVVVLAYTLVKHPILGIRLVVRRGLQYLLAKNVLRLILLAPALIVLVQILRWPDRSLADLLFRSGRAFYFLVMGTAAFTLRYRHEMSAWLDRRFFRVAIKEEETWMALIESIKRAHSEEEVAAAAVQQIDAAFAPRGIHAFFRSASDGELQVSFTDTPRDVPTVLSMLGQNSSLDFSTKSILVAASPKLDSTGSDSHVDDTQWLIVPLLGSDDESLGMLVLGPRKSEEPYSLRDRELLQAVGSQVVMACEVLRLKESVSSESRQRQAAVTRLGQDGVILLNECPRCKECHDTSMKSCPKDGAALELTLPVERTIASRYRLDRRLGAGGMGVVYQALDLRLNKAVALKIMIGELFGNQAAFVRFKREARAVALLRHPNIVGVHDFGQLPAGGAFFVMDLVRGLSWRQHLKTSQQVRPERVALWVEQLCAGTAAAHGSGVIHRDLKPENVFIAEELGGETVMILDFGIAKLHGASDGDDSNLTVGGTVIGTRSYMAPEQAAGRQVGTGADVYSIGVMALETLSRTAPPSSGANEAWLVEGLRRIECPNGELAGILRKALSQDPELRIKSARELGRLLPNAIRQEVRLPGLVVGSDDAETLSMGAAG
ncbi:MAG: protein kinase [Bryobacteraceae bacterium]